MKKKIIIAAVSTLALLLISSIPVFGFNVTSAKYLTKLQLNNAGNVTLDNVVTVSLNVQDMINRNMISANASDAVILDNNGNSIPFEPSAGNNTLMVFIDSMGENSQEFCYLYSKDATGGDIVYIPGDAGMSIPNSVSMNITNRFRFLIYNLYLDTTAGAGKNIIYKLGAVYFIVSPTVTGTLTFQIVGGATLSIPGIPSGRYGLIEVSSNTTDLCIYIDSVLQGTTAFTNNVTANGNAWQLFSGNTTMFVGKFEMYK
jgi:hypothetical protein